MYPELINRPELKVFLPPIGSSSVYIFGPIENLSDESKKLTIRYFNNQIIFNNKFFYKFINFIKYKNI